MTKKKTEKKENVFLTFWEALKNAKKRNRISNTKILTIGFAITCIILSCSSGIVDIACGSGLSKSTFHLGTLEVKAAILYTAILIGLVFLKFFCAMYIGMLEELKAKLIAYKKTWAKNINKPLLKWKIVHKSLIVLSLITGFNMSVNSIGSGIRAMQQNIDNMSRDAQQLIELNKSVNSGVKENRSAKKDNIMSTKNAQDDAKKEVEKYWTLLDNYQTKIRTIRQNEELADEDKDKQIAKIKKEAVDSLPVVSNKNVEYISKPEFEREFAKITKSNEIIDNSSVYEEAIAYDKSQIEDTILAISDKEYKMPDGTVIQFIDDGKPINVQLAISRLQNGISMWQADTGDVGESSKMFTLLATYIKADISAGGMGTSELMLMIFIIFLAIIQEIGIAYCTPAAIIDRATLKLVSRYCEWESNIEKEDFLIDVYIEYVSDGVFSEATFEEKCQKSGRHFLLTRENIKEKYIPKPKTTVKKEATNTEIKKGYSNKVDNLVKEIEELI